MAEVSKFHLRELLGMGRPRSSQEGSLLLSTLELRTLDQAILAKHVRVHSQIIRVGFFFFGDRESLPIAKSHRKPSQNVAEQIGPFIHKGSFIKKSCLS